MYQQPPNQPPDHTRRNAWLIIIAIVVVGFLIIGALQTPPAAQTAPTPDATPTQAAARAATATPTDTPIPTATPSPTPKPTDTPTPPPTQTTGLLATHGTPRLGGPVSDFVGKYGPPNDHTDASSFHWFRDNSSSADGLIVWELTHPLVDGIDVGAVNGDMPDLASAVALCTVYNPSDAHQVKRIPLVDSSGKDAGFDVIYTSVSLARTFAPSDFTDADGNTVQPGSFDIQYLYKGDGTQDIDSCSILPGEQQTQL